MFLHFSTRETLLDRGAGGLDAQESSYLRRDDRSGGACNPQIKSRPYSR